MRYYIGNSLNHKRYVSEGEVVFQASTMQDHKESFDIGIEITANHLLVLVGVSLLGPNKWPTEIEKTSVNGLKLLLRNPQIGLLPLSWLYLRPWT